MSSAVAFDDCLVDGTSGRHGNTRFRHVMILSRNRRLSCVTNLVLCVVILLFEVLLVLTSHQTPHENGWTQRCRSDLRYLIRSPAPSTLLVAPSNASRLLSMALRFPHFPAGICPDPSAQPEDAAPQAPKTAFQPWGASAPPK